MPADNITRAIARGPARRRRGAHYEEIIYEGYGPAGTALIVQALTDNRNRTVADVRSIFTRCGGNLGETGSVAWMFDAMGLITVELTPNQTADDVELQAIDAGARRREGRRRGGRSLYRLHRAEGRAKNTCAARG